MRHLDLFSGIGGFALASSWVFGEEYQNIGHSEIEPYACKVYHRHFPGSPCLGDITKIKWQKGRAELITAGFPCQPHSVAGKRGASKDERDLWGNVLEPFAEFDHATHSLRTYQVCLPLNGEHSSTEFCRKWPRAGMMRNGRLYRLRTLALPTKVGASGLWPRPNATDAMRLRFLPEQILRAIHSHKRRGVTMGNYIARKLAEEFGASQTPRLTEAIMGFPPMWTALEDSATQSSHR